MKAFSGRSVAVVLAGALWLLLTPVLSFAAPWVHSSVEVEEQYCFWSDGRLYFQAASGERWELITSVDDPEIANPGDGQFHPLPQSVVSDAISGITYPISQLNFDVYILPYPRRGNLKSSAGEATVYLSPGTREYTEQTAHALVAHEIGHQVHRAYLPDEDASGWETYARLRGFHGDPRFSPEAAHAYRPREVFAEDFRALFGSHLARQGESLENPELVWPSAVAGLADYMRRLPAQELGSSPLAAYPNPFRARVRVEVDLERVGLGTPSPVIVLSGDQAGTLSGSASPLGLWWVSIFDARGRLTKTVPLRLDASGKAFFEWDGNDRNGRRVPRGVFFARLSQGSWSNQPVAVLKLILAR